MLPLGRLRFYQNVGSRVRGVGWEGGGGPVGSQPAEGSLIRVAGVERLQVKLSLAQHIPTLKGYELG